jgi:hypothetical protein
MPPSHSFDETTLDALRANDIFIVTDGIGSFPYRKKGILLIPQLFSRPYSTFWGIYTICIHLNSISDVEFNKLCNFITEQNRKFISVEDLLQMDFDKLRNKVTNVFVFITYKILNKLFSRKNEE